MNFDKKMIEAILSDVREHDPIKSEKIINKEGWENFEHRQEIYVNRRFRPDAERWEYAIKSYQKYPYFKDWGITTDKSGFPIICFSDWDAIVDKSENPNLYQKVAETEKVFMAADLLTNPNPIITCYNSCPKEKRSALLQQAYLEFLNVSYTVGNFSPVWFNPSTGRGNRNDTIWYKLVRHLQLVDEFKGIFNQSQEKYKGLAERRKGGSCFEVMFSSTSNKKEVIDALLLQDFFNDGKIINQDYIIPRVLSSQESVDAFEKCLEYAVTCIVSRGYRILAKSNPNEEFLENDIENIKNIKLELSKRVKEQLK